MNLVWSHFSFAIVFAILIVFHCSTREREFPKDEDVLLLAWLHQQSMNNRENPLFDCSSFDGRFQTMLDTGPGNVCTQCHNEELRVNDFIITNHSMVQSRTIPGFPSRSLIYIKITEGSMRNYANAEIRQGIYCWIWQGSMN